MSRLTNADSGLSVSMAVPPEFISCSSMSRFGLTGALLAVTVTLPEQVPRLK